MKFIENLLIFLGLKKTSEEALLKLHTDALGLVEKAKTKVTAMEKVAEAHVQQAEKEVDALAAAMMRVISRRNTVQAIHQDAKDSLSWLTGEEKALEDAPVNCPVVSTPEAAATVQATTGSGVGVDTTSGPATMTPDKPDAPAS